MIKAIKRATALLIAVVICLSFAGCHQQGEVALRVNGEEFTSAFYSCALLSADMEAQDIMVERYDTEATTIDNSMWINKTIDEKSYSDWVKNRALEIVKGMMTAKQLCLDNKIETAKYFESAETQAEYSWSSKYAEYFEKNGVSLETYKKYSCYEQYSVAYFDFIYGDGGEKAVPNEDIKKHVNENYAYIDIYTVNITDMSTEEVTAIKEKLEGYKERIDSGESFTKIYAEATGTEYKFDSTDTDNFSNTLATVWGSEGTSYANQYFTNVKDMKVGECSVVAFNENDIEYAVLILKGDPNAEANPNRPSLYSAARNDLKGDEFEQFMQEKNKNVTIKTVKYAINQFKVKNIYFPEQ